MEDIAKLEYDRYLKEVVETLETDDMFRKKLEDATADEIKVNSPSFSGLLVGVGNICAYVALLHSSKHKIFTL